VVVAPSIIQTDVVRVMHVPQTQVAICSVIAVWLSKTAITNPPRLSVAGPPRFLGRIIGIHRRPATTAAVLWPSDVHEEVRFLNVKEAQLFYGLPILLRLWRPNLPAVWAATFLRGLSDEFSVTANNEAPWVEGFALQVNLFTMLAIGESKQRQKYQCHSWSH